MSVDAFQFCLSLNYVSRCCIGWFRDGLNGGSDPTQSATRRARRRGRVWSLLAVCSYCTCTFIPRARENENVVNTHKVTALMRNARLTLRFSGLFQSSSSDCGLRFSGIFLSSCSDVNPSAFLTESHQMHHQLLLIKLWNLTDSETSVSTFLLQNMARRQGMAEQGAPPLMLCSCPKLGGRLTDSSARKTHDGHYLTLPASSGRHYYQPLTQSEPFSR